MGQVERYVLLTKTQRPKCTAPCEQRYFYIYPLLIEQMNGYTPQNFFYKNAKKVTDKSKQRLYNKGALGTYLAAENKIVKGE